MHTQIHRPFGSCTLPEGFGQLGWQHLEKMSLQLRLDVDHGRCQVGPCRIRRQQIYLVLLRDHHTGTQHCSCQSYCSHRLIVAMPVAMCLFFLVTVLYSPMECDRIRISFHAELSIMGYADIDQCLTKQFRGQKMACYVCYLLIK